MASDLSTDILDRALVEAGLRHRAFVDCKELRSAVSALPVGTRARYGVEEARGAVVVALPYGEGDIGEPEWARVWPGERAALTRFARANWYGELLARLKTAGRRARTELAGAGAETDPTPDWRCLVNSALPEKTLARISGLGVVGRHSLIMVPEAGPAVVLGLILLPFSPRDGGPAPAPLGRGEPGEACGGCRSCIEACPTGALSPDGRFDRLRCLQHWSALEGGLPPLIEAQWGRRLYGCDRCLEACPRFKPEGTAQTGLGRLGAGLPIEWLLGADDAEIRSRLRGSTLDRRWIPPSALRRNARLASRSVEPTI